MVKLIYGTSACWLSTHASGRKYNWRSGAACGVEEIRQMLVAVHHYPWALCQVLQSLDKYFSVFHSAIVRLLYALVFVNMVVNK